MSLFIGQYHWGLGLWAALGYIAVGAVIPVVISRKSGNAAQEFRSASGDLSSYVLDSIRGLNGLTQYGSGEKRLSELNRRSDELSGLEEKMKRLAGRNMAATNTVILFFGVFMLGPANPGSSLRIHQQQELERRIYWIMRFSGPNDALYHPSVAVSHLIQARKKGARKMKVKNIIFCVAGIVLTGLGAVGAAVPLLPAFPFLLGAVFCFGKSSERLHTWFLNTRLYKNNLENYVQKKAMTPRAKAAVICSVTVTMGIGFAAMGRIPVGRIILAFIWLFHILYFIFGIKTIKADKTGGTGVTRT